MPLDPAFQNQDFYIPAFEVRVEDAPVGRDVIRDILSVSYRDSLTEIDSFEITINNWDAGERFFKYSDQPLFDPGKKLDLSMGYFGPQPLQLMVSGQITSLRPSFPAAGQPTLVISGQNVLHRLRERQISRSYINQTDNQIAQAIGQRLSVTIQTEESGPAQTIRYPYLLQDNQFDIVFLLSRALRIGYDLYVEEETTSNGQSRPSVLNFMMSTDERQTTYTLKYGLNLIEFSPELTTANQVGKVTVKGWDPVRKEPISETVTRQELRTRGVGSRGRQQVIEDAIANKEEIITNQPVNTKAEARQLARETLERIAKDMVKGTGSVVGLPELRAGSVVFLDGMGDRFSGRYFVTSTTHAIGDSGYITRFECRREEI